MTTADMVRRFIEDELGHGGRPGGLPDDALLIDEGIVDSLGVFHLVAFIEGEFGIRVDDEELVSENFATITDIVSFIGSKLPARVAHQDGPQG